MIAVNAKDGVLDSRGVEVDTGAGVTGGDGVVEASAIRSVWRWLAIALPTADGDGWRFRGLTQCELL